MQPAAWHPRGAGPAPGTAPGAPWALQGSSAPRVSISAVTEPKQVTALRLHLQPAQPHRVWMLWAAPMRDAEERPCSRELRPRKPGGHGALLAELSCLAWAQARGCMQEQGCPPHSPQAVLSSSGRSASLRHAERTRAYRKCGGCCIPLPPPSIDSGAMLS